MLQPLKDLRLKSLAFSLSLLLGGTLTLPLAVSAAPTQMNAGSNGANGAAVGTLGSGATGAYLGTSAVPHPASTGGMPQPVNNLGYPQLIGGNVGLVTQPNVGMGSNGLYAPYGYGMMIGDTPLQGQPAWAQGSYYSDKGNYLLPFGASLFKGRFAGTYSDSINPSYCIAPGDRIVIRVWGARQYDDVLVVDQQGNIFIPEVGPIQVLGITNAQLQSAVKGRIGQVFTSNVEVYVNLLSSQPVAVYVAGYVVNPGQYAGGVDDSLLSYLDRAGGIDFRRGSFRNIEVKRNGQVIASYDLYSFILDGSTPRVKLQDGDVIVATERGPAVSVRGLVREEAFYELKGKSSVSGRNGIAGKGKRQGNGAYGSAQVSTGEALLALASPESSVSHVSVSGTRNQRPIHQYLSLESFKDFVLEDGDIVTFAADVQGQTIITKVSGAIEGLSHFPINKNRHLRELLSYIEVDPSLGDLSSVYVKRKSVAEQQKQVISDALRRLEKSALTATSASVDEADIRVQEATLIQDFVRRAQAVEPDGIVVVSRGGVVSDIRLEDGDEIVIPNKTDVVLVAGEVFMPKAVTYDPSMSLDDYLGAAGGVSNRADDKNILVAKANGEVGLAEDLGIEAGDQILVMPKFDTKNMQLAKDIMQIIYQMAVATKVAVDL